MKIPDNNNYADIDYDDEEKDNDDDDDDDDGGGGEIRNVKLVKSKVRLLCFDFEKHKKCSMFPIDVLATM